MKFILTILFLLNTLKVYSQIESLPILRIYKNNKSTITIPLQEIDSLVQISIVPVNLTLADATNITNTSATFDASILSYGEGNISGCGYCWSTTENPTISENKIIGTYSGKTINTITIYSLTRNTKYYVRAYASNETGISYSNQIEFTTLNKEDFLFDSVKIGTQIWTTKNLDVSTYRNGESIRHARTPEEWRDAASKGEGAWCYYNYDVNIGKIYGKLYNFWAVADSRGLAPSGYHIPSDLEWSLLTEYLGGEEIAGFKMKSKSGWINDGNGDNSSGFNGLPGGCYYNGDFSGIPGSGSWWSSSTYNSEYAWIRVLKSNNTKVIRYNNYKDFGFSIRCIMD